MTNSFHRYKKQRGAAVLLAAITLMLLSTLIVFFTAKHGIMQDKITGNLIRNKQAFTAAEAGLEFGINYLQQNPSILTNPVNGYIPAFSNASTTNVVLANGSQYSITYTNPVAYDYTLIKITSVGTSDDGSATRTVSMLVKHSSLLFNTPSSPLTSKGNVSLGGSSKIITQSPNTTNIISGGGVSISGNGKTMIDATTISTAGLTSTDVQANNSAINATSESDFFSNYFGMPMSSIKNSFAHYYTGGSNTNYSDSLNGLSGTSIWIDQPSGSATINGTTTIGTSSNPVILVINGDITISGNVTIYGFVFVMGQTSSSPDITGNVAIIGAIVTAENFSLLGSTTVTNDQSVLSNIQNNTSMSYYSKVPGSWKDF